MPKSPSGAATIASDPTHEQNAAEERAPVQEKGKTGLPQLILLITIFYVAMNLRPALIGVGPVIDSIRDGLGLSATALGVLLTLPVLCFGIFAPFAPRLLRWQPAERIIFFSLLLLAAGILLRSWQGTLGLFAGTLLLGLAISVVMVLLPAIIKQHFPVNAGLMMGLYSTALAGGASIAAGITVPLEHWFNDDWRYALAFWVVPALLAAIAWLPQSRGAPAVRLRQEGAMPRLRGNWLAWQVTLFMGTQGAIAYCVFGWLPLILVERGLSAMDAGFVLAGLMTVQLSTSITGPWLATRGRDQRPMIFVFLTLVLVGLLGLIYGSMGAVYLWAVVFGLGFGGMFSVAMSLLVLRSANPQVAASLSGMAQGVGYVVAAAAPLIVGVLHEYTGDWSAVTVFLVLLVGGAMWSGLLAGRAKVIGPQNTTPK
ncbi:MAG TPA: MFS transporter [Pusillimonas sp.]|uniref:CynX/NimT family MFS transporter n=1 Tax=Pusillimonas sp. TaxID=3040095 RepID=UPI002C80D3AE|nr:MFS transporter [Pusillimonas sp.]HUH88251.1 MFS transporter [Pusillimonas sp.]